MNAERESDDRSAFILHRSSLEHGVALFNSHEFWHAHEAWEEIWLQSEGDTKQFLQGLIQLAAAYHHVKRGTLRGAPRLFDAALRRLSGAPDHFFDIDRRDAVAAATRHRDALLRGDRVNIEDAPRLKLIALQSTPLTTT